MDLLVVDPTTFLPISILEGWDSLIWTERYLEAGEFELHTYDIQNTLNALLIDDVHQVSLSITVASPPLVTLRDSNVVMIVESHHITTDDNGVRVLITKGRSLDSFLEQRLFPGTVADQPYTVKHTYTAMAILEAVLWEAFRNTNSLSALTTTQPVESPFNHIYPSEVSHSTTGLTWPSQSWQINPDYMDPTVRSWQQRYKLGIRTIRPPIASASIVDIDVNTGTITRTVTSNVNALLFDVYDYTVRTKDQSVVTPVIFSEAQGHLESPEYLITNKLWKNTGHWANSSAVSGAVVDEFDFPSGSVDWDGLTMRILWHPDDHAYNNATNGNNKLSDQVTNELVKTRRNFFISGRVSSTTPYKYNVDYFLGDRVTVVGSYGIIKNVRVTEYVRTQDKDGEQGYPTLTLDDVTS